MILNRNNGTPNREAVGSGVRPQLSNNRCRVEISIKSGDVSLDGVLETEAEVRNFIARMAPPSIITSNPNRVIEHLTGDADAFFNALVETAKAQGLSLPADL